MSNRGEGERGASTRGVPLGVDVVREDVYRGAHASNPVALVVR